MASCRTVDCRASRQINGNMPGAFAESSRRGQGWLGPRQPQERLSRPQETRYLLARPSDRLRVFQNAHWHHYAIRRQSASCRVGARNHLAGNPQLPFAAQYLHRLRVGFWCFSHGFLPPAGGLALVARAGYVPFRKAAVLLVAQRTYDPRRRGRVMPDGADSPAGYASPQKHSVAIKPEITPQWGLSRTTPYVASHCEAMSCHTILFI